MTNTVAVSRIVGLKSHVLAVGQFGDRPNGVLGRFPILCLKHRKDSKEEIPENHSADYWKQSFLVLDNEHIVCKFDPKLALSVNEFGRLCLDILDPVDPRQKWQFMRDGQLVSAN